MISAGGVSAGSSWLWLPAWFKGYWNFTRLAVTALIF
jgi:hypothetical protein